MNYGLLAKAVVFLPLFAAVLALLWGKNLGRPWTHRICVSAVGISFVLSCLLLYAQVFLALPSFNDTLYLWGSSGDTVFQVGFLIDRLSSFMMVVVTFISWMVHIYTIGYMQDDPGYQRFFGYISLFTFGMLMLVMANNFMQLFFGWEMVGLMSYLLIGFWFQKESANRASLKAFLVNRVGDLGFLIGIAGVLYFFGSLNYDAVFAAAENIQHNPKQFEFWGLSGISFITLCLFVGAMGKSAQMPLHVWLPDSMEGPTPISALIHAATMVTAGVFMLARMSPLFEHAEFTLNVILCIGAITAFFTGLLALVQKDIKRIIAYSTLSQLGYMMVAMGVSAYSIGLFHLMTHAFFKALLFLGAGSVIIALHHQQNIWEMGNLRKYLPITYITMLIGSLALIGFPGFSGFYSKDLIIEAAHASNLPAASFAYWAVLISVFVTALYTFRLFFVVFHGSERMTAEERSHLHESPWVMVLPLLILALPSIFAGMTFVGPALQGFFGAAVLDSLHNTMNVLRSEYSDAMSMGLHGFFSLPFILGILGILFAWLCYVQFPNLAPWLQHRFRLVYEILKHKYGFDILYEWILAKMVRMMAWFCFRIGDQWMIDDLAVNGTARGIYRLAGVFRKLQTGYLYHYAFAMIAGLLLLIFYTMEINR